MLLLVAELLYFPIARHFKIGAKPNTRSSHNEYRITGGGFIFWLAAVLFTFFYGGGLTPIYRYMLTGATVLAVVSFIDDINDLSPWLRLFIQTIVVAATFHQFAVNGNYDVFLLVLICGVGFINAFNFMDGINGIMAGYSAVTLLTMLYCFCQTEPSPNAPIPLIVTLIISVGVFAVFNYRVRAVCFAGDVGSIVLGFFITYLMIELITAQGDASCIIFLIVYAVDTVYTIFQRLFIGENILTSHRHHLYQLLVNERKTKHYIVASGYAGTQLAVNIGYFITPVQQRWAYDIVVLALLTAAYFIMRSKR
jgi:UDP-N-acetylmuramyl pentapeptide phosphotransferase/UDP-N-acetylglucosamine-1-phosphate transferase